MKISELSVGIKRSPQEIWDRMTDLSNMPKWDRGVLEARETSGGDPGVGSTIETRRRFLGRERVGRLRITEWTPPNRMELHTRLGPMEGSLSYQLEPVERGTRVAAGADVDIRGLWRLLAPLVVRLFTRDVPKSWPT